MNSPKPDYAVRDWGTSKPKTRDQVRFHYQDDNGSPIYVLEDLVNRSYIQIGVPEYRFIRGLDGSRSAAQLLSSSAGQKTGDGLSEDEVSTLLRWLLDQQLLEPDDGQQGDRRFQHHEEQHGNQSENPLTKLFFWRIPLGSPDGFFDALNRAFGWIFSLPFLAVWLGATGYGGYLALTNWKALLDAGSRAVLPANWLSLILVYVALKFVHEIGHGIATKRFRGVVPEWGIQLIAFVTPLTYVDATASWAFRSRRHRLIVAAAGMYVELFVAAIALSIWSKSGPGTIQTLAANTVIAASTITLLFNANPLMRFDGYYMLCDAIGIRNLAPRGQQLIQWIGRRFLLGQKDPMPRGTRRQTRVLLVYGILGSIWRLLIVVGVLALVSQMFKGSGIVLAALSVLAGLAAALYRLAKLLAEDLTRFWTAAIRLSLVAALFGAALWAIQIRPAPTALALVEFPEKAVLRAQCPGFVAQVACRNGDRVKAGDLLATLENLEEEGLLEQLQLDLKRSQQQALTYLNLDQLASYQAELEVQKSIAKRVSAQKKRVQGLKFRSPIDGVVDAPNIESIPGRYIKTGERLFAVYPHSPPQLLISARQADAKVLTEETPHVRFHLRGREGALDATIRRVEKRATVAVPHWALAASSGGPLPVREASLSASRKKGLAAQPSQSEALSHFRGVRPESDGLAQELARPRMVAYATIESAIDTLPLREGEWGYAKLTNHQSERLGSWIYRKAYRYIRGRFEQKIK